jgi:MFS family permease
MTGAVPLADTATRNAPHSVRAGEWTVSPRYAWLVLILTFSLLLSDYMSRQVLSAVFPLLKAEWGLSDTALGSLGSAVAIVVGLLTLPLSLIADRIGRIRSIVAMAMLWSLATLACALSRHYGDLLAARIFVGVGEAAYGSVGVAVAVSVFPPRMRALIVGMFTAGGVFGSVLGVGLGGVIAEQMGWRWSFAAMAFLGAALGAVYPLFVSEPARDARSETARAYLARPIALVAALFPNRTVFFTYIGSGLQLFISSSFIAWTPSFLHRYYGMGTGRAAAMASALVLVGGLGMIGWGHVADRLSNFAPSRRLLLACTLCFSTSIILAAGLALSPGPFQLVLVASAMLLAAGTLGPAGAIVADATDVAIHATVFAMLTFANNLLGLAPGPIVTGFIADHSNLLTALRVVPLFGIAAGSAFAMAYLNFDKPAFVSVHSKASKQ